MLEKLDPEIVWIDPEMYSRYTKVQMFGNQFFEKTNLVGNDPTRRITTEDLTAITQFHEKVSPLAGSVWWRKDGESNRELNAPDLYIPRKDDHLQFQRIKDPSTFGNWENPGGPLEHINLAMESANIITRLIQSNLKPISETKEHFIDIIEQLTLLDPLLPAAAAGLHDDGRHMTHLFYTNEMIGKSLHRNMGIRPDIIDAMPSETIMLVTKGMKKDTKEALYAQYRKQASPQNQTDQLVSKKFRKLPNLTMRSMIMGLSPQAVITRIADEFGKRLPGTERLYQPSHYTSWDRQAWVNGYMNRPVSGRPSETYFRIHQQLHVDNVPRYFKGLDYWVRNVSTLTLAYITQNLQAELGPTLRPLPRQNQ